MVKKFGATPSGCEITEEFIENAVAEAENGYDLTKIKLRPGPGRHPLLESEAAPVESVRLGVDLTKKAAERARIEGITKAELIRKALREYLRHSA
ncbi:MAG: ribbon-helix-helix protein, CopG family [Acidimicrobiales bacterium]|nr:ribbon-helix-helix protein, CopG family [Acidimicrobiales bacterium]